jgi:predicted alpha/beta superfamily hydrolase
VYVTDGVAMFPMVVSTAAMMILLAELPEMIVVGIGHHIGPVWGNLAAMQKWGVAKTKHLTPTMVPEGAGTVGGGAEKYLRFICEELIPLIDSKYATNPENRTLLGHSLGGLFTLYALFQHPETFNRYIAGSPSLWWDNGVLFKYEREFAEGRSGLAAKVFISVGFLEPEYMVTRVKQMADTLKSRNYNGLELTHALLDGETHMSCIGHAMNLGLQLIFPESDNLKEYTSTTSGFTFKHNDTWTDMKLGSNIVIIWLASAQYRCPGVHIDRYPKANTSTFEDLLTSSAYLGTVGGKDAKIGKTEEMTNLYGIKATAITFKYTAASGNVLDAKAYGFIKGDLWYVMSLYQSPRLGTRHGVMPDEVFNTWKFG